MCHDDFQGGDLPCQVEQAQAVRSSRDADDDKGCIFQMMGAEIYRSSFLGEFHYIVRFFAAQ